MISDRPRYKGSDILEMVVSSSSSSFDRYLKTALISICKVTYLVNYPLVNELLLTRRSYSKLGDSLGKSVTKSTTKT